MVYKNEILPNLKRIILIFPGLKGQRGLCLSTKANTVSATDCAKLQGFKIDKRKAQT